MKTKPLAGRGILVTRPAEQVQGLAGRIEALGGNAVLFPALEIAPPNDPAALAHVIGRLHEYHLIIFVSPTSVGRAWPFILERHGNWPDGFELAAVGRATAREMRNYGARKVLVPEEGADSESLLAMDELQDMAGKRILIVRGEGGRELLAATLRRRGAEVDYAEAYRRVKPGIDPAPLLELWRADGIQAVTVTSREILANLFDMLGAAGASLLCATPMFVLHPRIAEAARERGVINVEVGEPGDEGLVSALQAWFNPAHG